MKTLRVGMALQVCACAVTIVATASIPAQESGRTIEEVEVVGTTPTPGAEVERFRIPHRVVTIDSAQLEQSMSSQVSDHLARRVGGVFVNEAQGNPLQPDLQYRGFALSPLLGLPQGLAVYQDGVRLNEVFGDTLNWELIPENAIDRIDLISGSDPLYGLNTLGGVLSIRTKNGFDHVGHQLEFDGGSFGRTAPRFESGGNNGLLGYFIAASYEADDGWRDLSETDASNVFANLGWRPRETATLDLTVNYADSKLIGNGAAPEVLFGLPGENRESIFTAPDITENSMHMLNLSGKTELAAGLTLSGNAFYRDNRTSSFNGDGSEFEECTQFDNPAMEVLVEIEEEIEGDDCYFGPLGDEFYVTDMAGERIDEDGNYLRAFGDRFYAANMAGDFIDEDGNVITAAMLGDDGVEVQPVEVEPIEDQEDERVAPENMTGEERNAINNRSERDQRSYGGSLQAAFEHVLAGFNNRTLIGGTYLEGDVDFYSSLEIATLQEDRSTAGEGIFIPEDGVRLRVQTRNYSGYLSDTLSVTDQIDITASVRYNHTRVELRDRGGNDNLTAENPDLTDSHSFNRFNPAAGITWRPWNGLTLFGGYSESSRAPTAVELACADEDAPCNLPNAFLADPPLDQVIAKTAELGLRWAVDPRINVEVSGFFTRNEDDILFQSTGGTASNEGFFDNVGTTRRLGLEAGFHGSIPVFERDVNWGVNYAYLDATYRDSFMVASANHPYPG